MSIKSEGPERVTDDGMCSPGDRLRLGEKLGDRGTDPMLYIPEKREPIEGTKGVT